MEVKTKKQELMEWLEDIEDLPTLLQVEHIKKITEEPFDFDREWERGYTPEEAKAASIQKIRAWWPGEKMTKTPLDFDKEWAKGFRPEESKAEIHKRIQAYPWKK